MPRVLAIEPCTNRCVRCVDQSGFAVERGMRGKKKRSGPKPRRRREGETLWHAVGSHGETRRRRVGQRSRPQERRKGSPQSPVAGHDRRQVRRRWMPVGCTIGRSVRRGCEAPSLTRSEGGAGQRGVDAKRRAAMRGSGHGAKRGRSRSSPRRGPAPGGRGASHQAATVKTGIPSWRALSTRLPVMPEPGNAMTPVGRKLRSSSLRRKGAALP